MIDIRSQLMRSKTVPQVNRQRTVNITIHYNGPSVANVSDINLLHSDARFHVETRGWEGIAYHFSIGRDGQVYQNRDWNARLNHCGVPQGNSESLSVLVINGEGDIPPDVQLRALEAFLSSHTAPGFPLISPRYILSHREWPRATSCPGAQLTRWLAGYRATKGTSFDVRLQALVADASVRDEPSVLSHRVRVLSKGEDVNGHWVLGSPYRGDSLWLKVGEDYIHGSLVDTESYTELP